MGQDINVIKNTLNAELRHLFNWIKSNKLTLNTSKTHYMISSPLMSQSPKLDIFIDDNLLDQVSECKFLGVIIDNRLIWRSHVAMLNTKLSKLIGVLFKVRNNITTDCLRQIYLSLAYPSLLYCSSVWGGAFDTLINDIFITQKKLLRVITFTHRYAHTDPLFKELKLLKFHDIITFQTVSFVHKSLYFSQIVSDFQRLGSTRNTRYPNNLVIPLCRTSHAKRCLSSRGASLWNLLPEEMKNIAPKSLFKNKIKGLFIGENQ